MIQQIKHSLGDCKFTDKCICTNKTSYEEYNETQIFVYDDELVQNLPVRTVSIGEQHQLEISNPNAKTVTLIKNDNCLSASIKGVRKCDCIITDNAKLYFVEIKSVKAKRRSDARKEAIEQLIMTIEYFRDNNISLDTNNTFAIICFKTPKKYPISAANNSAVALFYQQYKVILEEKNLLIF
jgi:hypothetical protein